MVLSIIACKEAVPERASDRHKAEESIAKENSIEFFTLRKVDQPWSVRTGNEIGYEMTIALYRDQSFIKQMKTGSNATTLKGYFKDTTVHNQPYVALHFQNLTQPDSYVITPVYQNIYNNLELLERTADAGEGLLSLLPGVLDGVHFFYNKEK